MKAFSKSLINEYKNEMLGTYDVSLSDAEAQIQLRSLVRSMFPSVIAEQRTESREQGARKSD